MPTLQKIYPEYIRRDGATQPRESIDRATCNEYHDRMKVGEKFPPIDVYFDGSDHWLVDGFHRIEAYALALPGEPIDCNVFEGNLQDAQWYSYSVNKTHGVRRTNPDKERAVKAALGHPNGVGSSDRQIAEHVGVSHEMVRKYRKQLTVDCQKLTVNARKGRDGRTINTAKIGKSRATKGNSTRDRGFAGDAAATGLGHGLPEGMIALHLAPDNPAMAAETIFNVFDIAFIRALLEQLSQRLNGE